MAITPFFSLYTAIKLVYDIYEFYEADIKVYILWNNEKIFDVKNVKYEEIQSLNFYIEEKYIHRRINGKNTKIYFLIKMKYENGIEEYIVDESIIHAFEKRTDYKIN